MACHYFIRFDIFLIQLICSSVNQFMDSNEYKDFFLAIQYMMRGVHCKTKKEIPFFFSS